MLAAFVLSASWAGFSFQDSLSTRIDKILDNPAIHGGLAGVCVMKPDGTVLYERNVNLRMVPASNQKILSVAFALHTLGPEWRPKTRFWKRPDRIVVDVPGDPSMTFEKLTEVAKTLGNPKLPVFARQGFRPGIPPTWENDDLPHRYAPRITALTVNRGSFSLVGEKGEVRLEPNGFGVRIMRFPGGTVRTDFDPFGNLMVVRGDVGTERKNLENFAIPEPDRAAASILGGPLFESVEVPQERPDVEVEGDSIGKMAKACLVPSDNYLAEGLMMLAAQKMGANLSNAYPAAANRMREFLTKTVGLTEEQVRPMDGSGMSRHNFVTPAAVAQILAWAKRQPWADLWVDAMAKPGSGTLSSRLAGVAFHGKTGSLNSVASLSGYVTLANGETLIVSILLNHFIRPASDARNVADAIVRELTKPVDLTQKLVRRGAEIEGTIKHEGPRAHSEPIAFDVDRISRSGRNGVASCTRPNRRTQPADAAFDRTKRMAFQLR